MIISSRSSSGPQIAVAGENNASRVGLSGIALALMACFLSGCTTPSFGERVRDEGVQLSDIGKDWEKGAALINGGNKKIRRGRDLVSEGEEMVARGREMQRESEAEYHQTQ